MALRSSGILPNSTPSRRLLPSLGLVASPLPGARWIDPENYHVTLRFIGNIDGMYANEIASMLFRINRKPFEVRLQGLTSFGGKKPRAVVAAVEPSRPLIELQAEHERLMQRVGLLPEGRKYSPHVTLARLRDSSARQVAEDTLLDRTFIKVSEEAYAEFLAKLDSPPKPNKQLLRLMSAPIPWQSR